ncbi:MAG: Aspartate racemase [Candidatus Magasanikbacteria bacterium GW2011_GWC2_37_14]|uniref:Aspartate racemase n=1 Tax=Candidatus Magasanikbacteria bacterium GW2011_GWC2_37_14 TaxID=1619046 RepID=A0A0G0IS02_9BACT|nr:MAG: Aspartate racemase [Candidatus Magasanikbacteria bacterium GW2011_GWC2_37_14]
MKNKKITIGILAGMGPKSTSPFLDLVIEQCQKQYEAHDDIDFPHIIIYSLPTPFYIGKKINNKEMELTIRNGLQKLESMGVDFIAMPCNIAHKYFDYLKRSINIPLLNIIEATANDIDSTTNRVAVLATKATMETNIYQKAIKEKNKEFIYKKAWQQKIDSLIQNIKKGESQNNLSLRVKEIIRLLSNEKVDTIIVACTDLTKVMKKIKGFHIIDSSEALAKETLKTYLNYSK